MSKIVCNIAFLQFGKSAPKNSSFKGTVTQQSLFGGLFSYTGREKATANSIELTSGGGTPPTQKKRDESFAGYTARGYATEKSVNEGKYFTMTNVGRLYEEPERMAWINASKGAFKEDGDVAWTLVVSLENYDLLKDYDIKDQNDFSKIASTAMYKFFRRNKFDPNNMIWWEDYHTNTKHPHMHITFLEKENHRTRGKLTQKELHSLSSFFINEIAARKTYKDKYKVDSKTALKQLGTLRKELVSSAKELDYQSIKGIFDLYSVLPKNGRLQYGSSMMIPYRKRLDVIVNNLLACDEIRNQYDSFIGKAIQLESNINDLAGQKVGTLVKSQDAKLRKQLANAILQEFKVWSEEGLMDDSVQQWKNDHFTDCLKTVDTTGYSAEQLAFLNCLKVKDIKKASTLLNELDTSTESTFLIGAYHQLKGNIEEANRNIDTANKLGSSNARHIANFKNMSFGFNKQTYTSLKKKLLPRIKKVSKGVVDQQEQEVEKEIEKFLQEAANKEWELNHATDATNI